MNSEDIIFTPNDLTTSEGQEKIADFLNNLLRWRKGVDETFTDLIVVNQESLIKNGKAYAKSENLFFR